MAAEYRPNYLALYESREMAERVQALERLLLSCTVCPHDCGNNRMEDQLARCFSGRLPIVSSYTQHFGEEPALVGTHGAGNIFFGYYYLRQQSHSKQQFNGARLLSMTAF